MTCTCGHANPDTNHFCGMCGAKLERAPESPSVTPSRVEFRDPTDPARVIAPPGPAHLPKANADARENVGRRVAAVPMATAVSDETRNIPELRQPDSPADAPIAEPTPSEVREYSFGGPSFLGLGGSDESESDRLSYLTDDVERPRRSVRWGLLAGVALLVFMAAVIYSLYTNRESWDSTIVKDPAAQPPQQTAQANPPEPPQPQKTEEPNSAIPQSDVVSEDKDAPAQTAADVAEKDAGAQTKAEERVAAEPKSDEGADEETAEEETRSRAVNAKPSPSRREAPREENYAGSELYARGDAYLRTNNCGGVDLIRSAADSGHPQAASRMGALYYTGKCVDQSYAQAYEWFTRAKQHGLRSPSLDTMLARARANMETSAGSKTPERF